MIVRYISRKHKIEVGLQESLMRKNVFNQFNVNKSFKSNEVIRPFY